MYMYNEIHNLTNKMKLLNISKKLGLCTFICDFFISVHQFYDSCIEQISISIKVRSLKLQCLIIFYPDIGFHN